MPRIYVLSSRGRHQKAETTGEMSREVYDRLYEEAETLARTTLDAVEVRQGWAGGILFTVPSEIPRPPEHPE